MSEDLKSNSLASAIIRQSVTTAVIMKQQQQQPSFPGSIVVAGCHDW
jgi:hypothetical protein